MDHNTAIVIVLSTLFGSIGLVVIVTIISGQITARRKSGSNGLSVDEWASRLHALALELKKAEGADERAAGHVLLTHAHLLRPGASHCGCVRQYGTTVAEVED